MICRALSFTLFKLLSLKKKRNSYGHGQQCGDCGEDGGWLEVKEEVRGLNSSGKNIIKKNTLEILTSFFKEQKKVHITYAKNS